MPGSVTDSARKRRIQCPAVRSAAVDVPDDPTAPLVTFGLWFPLGTLAGFGLLSVAGAVAFPNAVLAVTLPTAVGWVVVGFAGSGRLESADDDAEDPLATPGLLLLYLSVTTAVGWGVVLLVFL